MVNDAYTHIPVETNLNHADLHVLIIRYSIPHEEEVYICTNQLVASKELYRYILTNWNEYLNTVGYDGDEDWADFPNLPDNPQDAIKLFFLTCHKHIYSIHRAPVRR